MPEPKGPYNLTSALAFWEKLVDAKVATIKFVKKNGATRIMLCTLDFTKIPKKDHPKGVNLRKIFNLMKKSGILHVYDLEKKGWRSVPFDKAEWVNIDNTIYKIRRK